MLDDIKIVLGIEHNKSDAILNLMIHDAVQSVLDYCHIKEIPATLDSLARGLVVQQFNLQNDGMISSIKRGDTQVSYHTPIGAEVFTERQRNRLNAYRKWRAR